MKKLILSMLVVLGTMASAQAQFVSFSFYCPPATQNDPVVLTLDGYSSEQLATLASLGFTPGTSGQPNLEGVISGYNISIAYSFNAFDVGGGVIEGGPSVDTSFSFKASGRSFTTRYSHTADEMIVIIQSLDLDRDGFTHEEEEELDLSGFDDDNGTYQYFYTPPSATGFYITISPEGNNLFFVYDDDGAITEMTGLTLREAVDYVRSLPVGQGTNG